MIAYPIKILVMLKGRFVECVVEIQKGNLKMKSIRFQNSEMKEILVKLLENFIIDFSRSCSQNLVCSYCSTKNYQTK